MVRRVSRILPVVMGMSPKMRLLPEAGADGRTSRARPAPGDGA
jgi:hypothetical protein